MIKRVQGDDAEAEKRERSGEVVKWLLEVM